MSLCKKYDAILALKSTMLLISIAVVVIVVVANALQTRPIFAHNMDADLYSKKHKNGLHY